METIDFYNLILLCFDFFQIDELYLTEHLKDCFQWSFSLSAICIYIAGSTITGLRTVLLW